eukprot:1145333-Lingulodinium_polyedra.AAC.1
MAAACWFGMSLALVTFSHACTSPSHARNDVEPAGPHGGLLQECSGHVAQSCNCGNQCQCFY